MIFLYNNNIKPLTVNIQLSNTGNMTSKKTTISAVIALTALALVTAPSVLTLGSVYAFQLFGEKTSQIDGIFSGLQDIMKKTHDLNKNNKKASDNKEDKASDNKEDKASDPKESSTDSDKPCIRDDNEKGTHYYCEGTHHHCKPGPDNPKCVKT